MPAPRTSQVLVELLVECLMDINLNKKVFNLKVDNYTISDAMIDRILNKISTRRLISCNQLFHMRSYAHMLNLTVNDGLSIIANVIEKVRENVNFWTNTPNRENKFIKICTELNILDKN